MSFLWYKINELSNYIVKGSVVDPAPELLPGSGSGIKVPDPDPAKYERPDKYKSYFSLNSGL